MRKSPRRHRVREHKRNERKVRSYIRGKGGFKRKRLSQQLNLQRDLKALLVKNNREAIKFLNYVGLPAPGIDIELTTNKKICPHFCIIKTAFYTKMFVNSQEIMKDYFHGEIGRKIVKERELTTPVIAGFVHEYLHEIYPKKSEYAIQQLELKLMYEKFPDYVRKVRKEKFPKKWGSSTKFVVAKAPHLTKWHPESQKLVWMNPRKFLEVTPLTYYDRGQLKKLKDRLRKGLPLDPLWMDVDKTGFIWAHEGRHRAKAAIDLEIMKVPVILYHNRTTEGKTRYYDIEKREIKPVTVDRLKPGGM